MRCSAPGAHKEVDPCGSRSIARRKGLDRAFEPLMSKRRNGVQVDAQKRIGEAFHIYSTSIVLVG
jgi:hypothetical protein